MNSFVDLHHHSEGSTLDGFGSLDVHAQRCKDLGHPAMAITEHGTLRGFVGLEAACKKHGLWPVYGCEIYVCRDHKRRGLNEEQIAAVTANKKKDEAKEARAALEKAEGIKEKRHFVLLAENEQGLQNLIRLNNIANLEGFYYKPRIDLDLLEQYNEGLLVNSACIGGLLAASFLNGDTDRLLDDIERLLDIFDDRFSIEIQPHPIEEQALWNVNAVKLAQHYDIPLVAANDSHYPAPDDWKVHDTMVCVGTRRKVADCERMRYVAETFGLKDAASMKEAFNRSHPELPDAVIEAALERSIELAERCRAVLPRPTNVLLPKVTQEDRSADDELTDLCHEGWQKRSIDDRAQRLDIDVDAYFDRLEHELNIVKDKGFAPYFIYVARMMQWARETGIMTGPGRGSSAGSLICYLLGITSLDPLEHKLLFERFLTPGRPDWPDIDCDVEDKRRGDVIQYLRDTYGEDCVAQISTVTRMRARSALRDVARAHDVPPYLVESVISTIIEEKTRSEPGESHEAIRRTLETSSALQDFADQYPQVVEHAMRLEGNVRHVGLHPAGVVVTPTPLIDFVPLEQRLNHGDRITVIAYDMRDTEKVGLLKLDVLGLRTLTILSQAVAMIERRRGVKINLEDLDFDDGDVLDTFTANDFAGVFQFDSPSARSMAKEVTFDSFRDIVAVNAINRPGPAKSGLAAQWLKRKQTGQWEPTHPTIEAICEDTYGVIVYQEHIIRILQELAGYNPVDAGRVRKMIAKSKGRGTLEEERSTFVAGAVKHGGMVEEEADALWTQIEEFGAYGFNLSHSAAYSALAYWCQWLKVKYPQEFFCALLANEPDMNAAVRLARDAVRHGVKVKPPNVNTSATTWSIYGTSLVAGLSTIKKVGERACESLEEQQPFSSFADFIERVDRRVVHKGVIEALVKSGAMRSIVPNVGWMLENYERLLKNTKKQTWREEVDGEVAASADLPQLHAEDEWALRIGTGGAGETQHPLGVLATMQQELLRDDFNNDYAYHQTWGTLDGSWLLGAITVYKSGTSGGEKWAQVELEDINGDKFKLRFGDAEYKRHRHVLDVGVGALVGVNLSSSKYGSLKPVLMVDMLALRSDWLNGELDANACVWTKEYHPVRRYDENPSPAWWRHGGHVLVLNVNKRIDSMGNPFAFVRVDCGVDNTVEVVVFNSLWASARRLLKVGNVVWMKGRKDRGVIAEQVKEA